MANQLHIYINNPTAGGTDGTEASSGAGTSPIAVTLDAGENEEAAVKCAVRCDSGYEIDGSVTVERSGTSAARWTFCADDGYADGAAAIDAGTFTDTLLLSGVAAANVIFWAKASSDSSEAPQKDTSVTITATGKVVVSSS